MTDDLFTRLAAAEEQLARALKAIGVEQARIRHIEEELISDTRRMDFMQSCQVRISVAQNKCAFAYSVEHDLREGIDAAIARGDED